MVSSEVMALKSHQMIVLASSSPRRRDLLKLAEIPFRAMPASLDERPEPGEGPEDFTRRAAAMKAHAISDRVAAGTWILAADTTVVVDGAILGKPSDRSDARRMLDMLSGRSHRVLTAVVLARAGSGRVSDALVETVVHFHQLRPEWIEGYLRTGEPTDKAGAYGIQGKGALLVRSIEGSYTNVVGLPLSETVQMLELAGIWQPFATLGEEACGEQAAAGGGK
jgi:septum formation protein